MKLLIIFNKDINISAEKICVHVGHSNRNITTQLFCNKKTHKSTWANWMNNDFKSVILRDKITDNLITKIKDTKIWYEIYDAGLDGTFKAGTILGYAFLVPKDNDTFKRLRTLKF